MPAAPSYDLPEAAIAQVPVEPRDAARLLVDRGPGAEPDHRTVADLPSLAFDHEEILDVALRRLKGKIRYEPIGFELLAEKFPLSELQRLYETILEQPLDKRNFRKKILSMGLLADTEEIQQDVAHRAARLYRFDEPAYRRLKKAGFNFEL